MDIQVKTDLPSQKARMYVELMSQMKKQQLCDGEYKTRTTRERVAKCCNDSCTQVQRYLRLNSLLPSIVDMVDKGLIGLTTDV